MEDIELRIGEINEKIMSVRPKTLSFSKCSDMLKTPFDGEATATNCHERDKDKPGAKYYGMSVQDILDMWAANNERSRVYGKKLDDYAEMKLTGKSTDLWALDNNLDYDERLKSLCHGFDQFMEILKAKTDYVFVGREIKLFTFADTYSGEVVDENPCINGRFDCLFYSPSADRYMLLDWKTNEEIKATDSFHRLNGPCFRLPDCNGVLYSLQLSMYKKALCETYGITTPDKFDIFICQFLTEPLANGNNYMLHKTYVDYDPKLLGEIIRFTYRKHEVLNAQK